MLYQCKVMIFSNAHLHINVTKVPSKTMLPSLPTSFNCTICFEISEDLSNRPDGYTTIDCNVFFFEKRGHSHNDLLHLDRDFATLGHAGNAQKWQVCKQVCGTTTCGTTTQKIDLC